MRPRLWVAGIVAGLFAVTTLGGCGQSVGSNAYSKDGGRADVTRDTSVTDVLGSVEVLAVSKDSAVAWEVTFADTQIANTDVPVSRDVLSVAPEVATRGDALDGVGAPVIDTLPVDANSGQDAAKPGDTALDIPVRGTEAGLDLPPNLIDSAIDAPHEGSGGVGGQSQNSGGTGGGGSGATGTGGTTSTGGTGGGGTTSTGGNGGTGTGGTTSTGGNGGTGDGGTTSTGGNGGTGTGGTIALSADGTSCLIGTTCSSGTCLGGLCQSLRLLPRWYAANNTEADDVWGTLVYRFGSLSNVPQGWTHVQSFDLTAQGAIVELGNKLAMDTPPVCPGQGTVSQEVYTDLGSQGAWVFQRINGGDSNRPTFSVKYTNPSGLVATFAGTAYVQFYVQYPSRPTDYKVVWVIYPNGAMRLNHLRTDPNADTTQQFSSSHWLGMRATLPDQVDGSGCLQNASQIKISSVELHHGVGGKPEVTMTGISQQTGVTVFDLSWILSIDDPILGKTQVHVTQTATAASDVALGISEGTSALFGPEMSSMYKSSTSFDANIIVSDTGPTTLQIGQLNKSPAGSNSTMPWSRGGTVRFDKDGSTTHNVLGAATSLAPL